MNEDAIFSAALEKESAQDRATFLRQACGHDDQLRSKIEALLRAHETPDSFLDSPLFSPAESASTSTTLEQPGTVIGNYKLLQQIGEGGFGVVFMAEQQKPVNRQVALKVIKPGMDSRQVIGRFEVERQVLAMMEHPNIAKIFDAGTTDSGRPFFVMELVKGIPITNFCDHQRLAIRERLSLFIDICKAIQHAHQKGIIHRDVKPSNLLISQYDGEPVPKVIDFGVAKAIHQRLTEKTMFTQFGQVIGTLEYMSPEQSEMNQLDVDTRSDIYSLGAVLYELLTGTTPIDHDRLQSATYDQIMHMIRDEEPQRPSVRLSTNKILAVTSAQRRMDPAKLSRQLQGELDWIVMKALDKQRTQRYQTAGDLARDVERYLNNDSVEARPPSAMYQLRKFAQKNRRTLTVLSTFALLLVLGTLVSSWLAFQAHNSTIAAQESAQAAKSESVARLTDLVQVNVSTGARFMEDGNYPDAALYFAEALRLDQGDPARERLHRIRCASTLQSCVKPVAVWRTESPDRQPGGQPRLWTHGMAVSRDSRLVVTFNGHPLFNETMAGEARVWDIETRSLLATLNHEKEVYDAAFSPDGKYVATASGDHSAQLWIARTGERIGPALEHELSVTRVAFNHTGDRLVTATGLYSGDGRDDHLRTKSCAKVWSVPDRRLICSLHHKNFVLDVAFSPDDRWVATASVDSTARIWDATTGQPRFDSFEHGLSGEHATMVGTVRFSADGTRLITGSSGFWPFRNWMWSTDTGKLISDPLDGHLLDLSSDGSLLLTASSEISFLWKVDAPRSSPLPLRGRHSILGRFDPSGRLVAKDRDVQGNLDIWDTNTRELAFGSLVHSGRVWAAEFMASGQKLITLDAGDFIRVWDLATTEPPVRRIRTFAGLASTSFGPSGKLVSQTSIHGEIRIYDLISGKELRTIDGRLTDKTVFSTDETRLLVFGGGEARIWNIQTGGLVCQFIFDEDKNSHFPQAAFSPTGRYVATGTDKRQVQIWDTDSGHPVSLLLEHDLEISHVAFSDSGDRLVTCTGSKPNIYLKPTAKGKSRVWRVPSGEPITSQLEHEAPITFADFSPDGSRLVTACRNPSPARCTAHVWDIASGKRLATIHHQADVHQAEFLPDGERIITLSSDGTARVWDSTNGNPVTPPMQHGGRLTGHFMVQGKLVLITDHERTQLWDVSSGNPLSVPIAIAGHDAFLSPDGNSLITTESGALLIWPVLPDPRPVADVVASAQLVAGAKIVSNTKIPLTAEEYEAIWKAIAQEPANFLGTSSEQLDQWKSRQTAWHLQMAETAKEDQSWQRTLFHLDQALESLSDGDLAKAGALADRGDAYAYLGKWDLAEKDIRQSVSLRTDAQTLYKRAQLHLREGRLDDHQKVCATMVESFDLAEDTDARRWLAETSVFVPTAISDWQQLARHLEGFSSWYDDLLRAAVLYRAGSYEKSLELYEKHPEHLRIYLRVQDYLFQAMGKYRLGETEAAREKLATANRLLEDAKQQGPHRNKWYAPIGVLRVRDEANELIGN